MKPACAAKVAEGPTARQVQWEKEEQQAARLHMHILHQLSASLAAMQTTQLPSAALLAVMGSVRELGGPLLL